MRKRNRYDLLPVIAPGRRPSVLLVGNGIVQAFDNSVKMDALIRSTWKKNHHSILPASNDQARPHPLWKLPFPMQIVVASKDHVQNCMKELAGTFKAADTIQEQEDMILSIYLFHETACDRKHNKRARVAFFNGYHCEEWRHPTKEFKDTVSKW